MTADIQEMEGVLGLAVATSPVSRAHHLQYIHVPLHVVIHLAAFFSSCHIQCTMWILVRQEVHTWYRYTGNARASRTGPGPNHGLPSPYFLPDFKPSARSGAAYAHPAQIIIKVCESAQGCALNLDLTEMASNGEGSQSVVKTGYFLKQG